MHYTYHTEIMHICDYFVGNTKNLEGREWEREIHTGPEWLVPISFMGLETGLLFLHANILKTSEFRNLRGPVAATKIIAAYYKKFISIYGWAWSNKLFPPS